MGRAGWVGLLLVLGCAPPLGAEEADDAESGETEPVVEEESLDVQAVVYAVSSVDGPGGAYYLRRLGEEPILLGESETSIVDQICLFPNGTGYVRWWPQGGLLQDTVRTERFAFGEDWAEGGLPSPFPAGVYSMICPMGWAPEAYYANLVGGPEQDDMATYRVLSDGSIHLVFEAEQPWTPAGDYAIDATETGANIWEIRSAVPRLARVVEGAVAYREGPWLRLDFEDGRLALLTGQNLEPTFIGKTPAFDFNPGLLSPSGRYGALAEHDEVMNRSSLTLFRVDEDGVIEQDSVNIEFDPSLRVVATDGGWAVLVDDERVRTLSFDEAPRDLVVATSDELAVYLSRESDLLLLGLTSEDPPSYTVHDLRDGSARPLEIRSSCVVTNAVGEFAYFICDGTHFERVALRSTPLELESLAHLGAGLPPLEVGQGGLVGVQPWNVESWHLLGFGRETVDGRERSMVLLRADGAVSIELAHLNAVVGWPLFFPPE